MIERQSLPEFAMSTLIPISTCDLCDGHKGDASGAFRVLPPVFIALGGRVAFAGPVSTVKCHEDNTSVKAAVESAGHGRVLVVDGGGSLRHALVGGNLAAAAARNGWAGLVVDGCVRDKAELDALDIGIRALALMPLPTERHHVGLVDVPVQVQGVVVRPGDWLVADADGIVVLAPVPGA
jgi:regulator of ribonuclease activity A